MTPPASTVRRLARCAARAAARQLPGGRSDWARAMISETELIDNDLSALGWAVGSIFGATLERLRSMAPRERINGVSGAIPVVLSLLAFGVALYSGLSGSDRGATDEGALAHIFQLLIVAELPIVAVFLSTADWRQTLSIARPLVTQAGGVALALGTVAFFGL